MPTDEKNPHSDAAQSPTRSVHHDVLVINPNHELYRFNVRKTDVGRVGEYLNVEYLGAGAPGHRKVMHIARKGPAERPRGAAFASLPVKEEPASSFMCCYLINAENINYRNVWTQAEWNDGPDTDDEGPLHEASDRDIRLLIAEHGGRVLCLNIPKGKLPEAETGWMLTPVPKGYQGTPDLAAIPLRSNPEVWNLLRNGCIAGSATYSQQDTPLLNLTALVPCREEMHVRRAAGTDDQITGTYDFKWPVRPERSKEAGGDVLVAFLPVAQKHYRMAQTELFELFTKYARTWQLDKLGIRVEFLTDLAFDAFDPADYDILVSLEPLNHSVRDEQGVEVKVPMAELGNFARRVDRGAASMFVGMPDGILDEDGSKMAAEKYPTSKAFQHFVVHEFGHALGLLHLHQNADLNPAAMTKLRKELKAEGDRDSVLDDKIRALIKERLGIEVPENHVEDAIRGTWPGTRRFSEWPPIEGDATVTLNTYLKDSILVGLAAHKSGYMSEIAPNQYLTRPSPTDLAWLQSLYPCEH